MKEALKRLRKINHLKTTLDGIIVFSDFDNPNYFYLTNSDVQGIFYYDFSSAVLYTNVMERSRAKKGWVRNIKIFDKKEFQNRIRRKRIGIDKSFLRLSNFEE